MEWILKWYKQHQRAIKLNVFTQQATHGFDCRSITVNAVNDSSWKALGNHCSSQIYVPEEEMKR